MPELRLALLLAISTLVCATVAAARSSPAAATKSSPVSSAVASAESRPVTAAKSSPVTDDSEEDNEPDYDAGVDQAGVTQVKNETHTVESVNVAKVPVFTCSPGFRPTKNGDCRPAGK